MTDWIPSHPRPTAARRLLTRARATTPWFVWAAAVAAAVALAPELPNALSLRGVVDGSRAAVVAPADGRVADLAVRLDEPVEAGQLVARLDDAELRLRLTQATYELQRIEADLARERAEFEREVRQAATQLGMDAKIEMRRLLSTVETAQLAALATRTELEEARVRLGGAAIEAERIERLRAQEVVGEPEVVRARTDRDALEKRVEELTKLYAEHQERIATADRRVREFDPGDAATPTADATLAPHHYRLKAQETALERIALDGKNLELRASISGRVAAVFTRSGEWLRVGNPVLEIVDPHPRDIRAYVPERERALLAAATTALVHRESGEPLGERRIASVSPAVVRVPARLWLDPAREEWAYELRLTAAGDETPGEALRVRLRR